ncbi:MAG: hypothetical protein ACRDD7_12760 [Peptostreptococcaceae bacterium]
MGLLQQYGANIPDIVSINVSLELYGGVYRVETIYIDGNTQNNNFDEISNKLQNKLANEGNLETEFKMGEFIAKELGLTSTDLINFI